MELVPVLTRPPPAPLGGMPPLGMPPPPRPFGGPPGPGGPGPPPFFPGPGGVPTAPRPMGVPTAAAPVGPSGKKVGVVRQAAGQRWVDPSLLEWPENDFRIFVGNLGNEVRALRAVVALCRPLWPCRAACCGWLP